jgi:hypothetical protein
MCGAKRRRMCVARVLLTVFLIALPTFFSDTSQAAPSDAPAHLVFVAYDGAMLEGHSGSAWVVICQGGCERDLAIAYDIGASYRITDARGRKSSPFRIAASPGERVTVTAHPPSQTVHEAGSVTTAIGVVGLIVSTVALGVVWVEAIGTCGADWDYDTGGYYPTPECPSFVPVLVALGVSAVVTVVGIALLEDDSPSASQSALTNARARLLPTRRSDASSLPLPPFPRIETPSFFPAARVSPLLTFHF